MRPRQLTGLLLLAACAFSARLLSQRPQSRISITSTRRAPDDLEITGLVANLPPGAVGYVSYAALATLPQITTTIQNDSNFANTHNIRVTGIPLDELAKALGALPEADLV